MTEQIKAIVTVSDMARMCGLSRARFYQLQKTGIFPMPLYDVSTRRPIYDEDMQKICLEVRRRNCGANGKPILFYARRVPLTPVFQKPRKTTALKPKTDQHPELVEALQALGLTGLTASQVGVVVKEVYPQGSAGVDHAEVVRAVFLHFRRKNSADNVR
jgi:hypothetical protein